MSPLLKLLLLSSLWSGALAVNRTQLVARAPSGSKSVSIQLFEWNWASIAAECTSTIGPAGYGFVQVSPPQESIQGSQWWTDYQPVSYNLVSKRGNRQQFSSMISACHAAGVGVIADAVINHMSSQESGTGTGGSSFTHYNYPGTYQSQDFHYCGLTSNNDIADYTNRAQVQTCELVNLADLATNTEYVRGRIATYLNDLLSLGVDGFRVDAAKHMAASDLSSIMSRLSRSVYLTQEVIYGSGEPVQPSEYLGIGDVQEFRYTFTIKDAFNGGSISGLQNLDNRGWIAGNRANVFVSNHDTERNGGSLSASAATYFAAHAFMLAHPYGSPTILSGYSFSNNDAGAPNGGAGGCSGTGGANGWTCTHRWTGVRGLVGFRNNAGSAALTNWVSPSSDRIAFGRGSTGFVAINAGASAWTATFSTSLTDGTYCDVVSGPVSSGACTGTAYTVSGGAFTATVAARGAVAIHTGAKGSGGTPGNPTTVQVTFAETATTVLGENIFLVGSLSQLGSWNTANAIALSSATYPEWRVTISLPSSETFQFKFLRKNASGQFTWESDPNRQATVNASGSQTITTSWR